MRNKLHKRDNSERQLSPDDFLIANSEEVVKELNNSFSCSVKSLNIPVNYEGYDSLSENIDQPTLRAIVSVATIQASLQLHRSIKIMTSIFLLVLFLRNILSKK